MKTVTLQVDLVNTAIDLISRLDRLPPGYTVGRVVGLINDLRAQGAATLTDEQQGDPNNAG